MNPKLIVMLLAAMVSGPIGQPETMESLRTDRGVLQKKVEALETENAQLRKKAEDIKRNRRGRKRIPRYLYEKADYWQRSASKLASQFHLRQKYRKEMRGESPSDWLARNNRFIGTEISWKMIISQRIEFAAEELPIKIKGVEIAIIRAELERQKGIALAKEKVSWLKEYKRNLEEWLGKGGLLILVGTQRRFEDSSLAVCLEIYGKDIKPWMRDAPEKRGRAYRGVYIGGRIEDITTNFPIKTHMRDMSRGIVQQMRLRKNPGINNRAKRLYVKLSNPRIRRAQKHPLPPARSTQAK